MSNSSDEVRIAVFGAEPVARMWAEALSREGVPALVRSEGLGPGHWTAALNEPHALYVLAPEEERARALIPQEFQVWPLPEKPPGFPIGAKTVIYLVSLALMGVLLWVAFFR
ncbi:MAG: hypothetical protein HYY01_14535 [Chloroflexi bacterium]|nr:hypothetical protein [Chloroflexota bacterium]